MSRRMQTRTQRNYRLSSDLAIYYTELPLIRVTLVKHNDSNKFIEITLNEFVSEKPNHDQSQGIFDISCRQGGIDLNPLWNDLYATPPRKKEEILLEDD